MLKIDGSQKSAVGIAGAQLNGHITHSARFGLRVHTQVVDAEIAVTADEQALHITVEDKLAFSITGSVKNDPQGNARRQRVQARRQCILNQNIGAIGGQVDRAAGVVKIHRHTVHRFGIASEVKNGIDGFELQVLAGGGRHLRIIRFVKYDKVAVSSGPE